MPAIPINQGFVTQNFVTLPSTSGASVGVPISNNATYLLLQNISNSDIWLSFSSNSLGFNGLLLKAGASIEFANYIPIGSINYACTSTVTLAYIIATSI